MFDVLTISTLHDGRNDTCAVPMESSTATGYNDVSSEEDEVRLIWQGWGRKRIDEETMYQNMIYASNGGESIGLNNGFINCQNVQAIVTLHCGKKFNLYIATFA